MSHPSLVCQAVRFDKLKMVWRPMEIEDLDQVISIEKSARPSPWSKKGFESDLGYADHMPPRLFVLEHEAEIVAYLSIWLIAGELQIQNIVVKPAFQGRKLGWWILKQGLKIGTEFGATRAILEVRESNKPAIHLYLKAGFQQVADRNGYYRDGENALLMTLDPIE